MGKLISVVGNSGVGKTTLTQALARNGRWVTGVEQHRERPFQESFAHDLHRFGLANQLDYLLFRAEQELAIRQGAVPGIQDGGLDLDFQVFTRLFHFKGYLSDPEFSLCERLYLVLRATLPPPDLILRLTAPLELLTQRYRQRGRAFEIAKQEDLPIMERLLGEWLDSVPAIRLIMVDAGQDRSHFRNLVPGILKEINRIIPAKTNPRPKPDRG
ncbi:MAG: deoxynucleoside kinase [Anaerolineales bacterium]|jgi:deoxyadenosine/deoxycytidine kinase